MPITCPNCGEQMMFQMERCPRCQTKLGAAPQGPSSNPAPQGPGYNPAPQGPLSSQSGNNFFGMERRDRTRDRSEVGDRSGMKTELSSVKGELDAENDGVRRERLRSELDSFNKGSDEHVPGQAPAPTPTAYNPSGYTNPYLNKQNHPNPRGQYAPSQAQTPPGQVPTIPQRPVPKTGEMMGLGSAGMMERAGMGTAGTLERAGMGSPGLSTMEFVLDGKVQELREIDELAFSLYGMDLRMLKSTLCETPAEWKEKMIADDEIPQSARQSIVANAEAQANVMGVFLPGKGLFVNGAAFPDLMGKSKPDMISTAVHEKLGHGFCNTYTLKGEDESKAGSALFRLAAAFGMKQIDEPMYPLWLQKKMVSLRSSFFIEEGFASWIQYHLLQEMGKKHPGKGYENARSHFCTPQQLMGALKNAEEVLSGTPIPYRNLDDYLSRWLHHMAEWLRDKHPDIFTYDGIKLETMGQVAKLARVSLLHILADDGADSGTAAYYMMALDACDTLLSSTQTLMLRYEAGFLVMERIMALFGARCVPAAVRIAGNVRFNLAGVSVDDLQKAVSDPNYCPDARLAAIARLSPDGSFQQNDPRAFVRFVNSKLGYSIPQGM